MIAFATNGALPATLLARYAEVKDLLGVDTALFGLLVAAFMLGAAAAFNTPGVLLRRFGSRVVTTSGTAWMTIALLLATFGVVHGNAWLFVAGLVLAGYGDAVVDVAQNAQGLRVQEAFGRSLLSSMHAGWSIGAAIGSLVGTFTASLGVPLTIHLAAWGIVCVLTMLISSRSFLPHAAAAAPDDESPVPARRLGFGGLLVLAPLALVALAGVSVEDVGNNWSAVLLADQRDVPAQSAGIALSVLLGAQFVGRLLGDRFIDRVGHRAALVSSLAVIVVGMLAAAWAPSAPLTIIGFALAGLGCAITVPLAFTGADALPGLAPHAGVTWVNWLMRLATIGLTPAIGAVAALSSLPVAITVVTSVAVVALALQFRPNRHT
nr:MFS transporter [Pseudoclavibacter chungangensis]